MKYKMFDNGLAFSEPSAISMFMLSKTKKKTIRRPVVLTGFSFLIFFCLWERQSAGRSHRFFDFNFFLWERQSAGRFHRFLMRMVGHHTCNLILEYCSSQSIASLLNDPQAFLCLFFLFLKTKNPQVNSSHELDELVIWRIISLPRVDNPPLV